MKWHLSISAVLITVSLIAQGGYEKSFGSLSPYEKRWTMLHPAAALKVKRLTKEALSVIDEVKKQGALDQYESGGRLDAFRHIYTMAFLARRISIRKLRSLGIAHEKGNYWQFKNGLLENGEPADSLSGEMDLRNNEIGFAIGRELKDAPLDSLKQAVISLINRGDAWVLGRDKDGNYITCEGKMIALSEWKGKWNIPKCLARSK